MKKIGFIGCGNMGEAMLAGALNAGWLTPSDIIVHTHTKERMSILKEKYDIEVVETNERIVQNAQMIILAVKPNLYEQVINEIKHVIHSRTILVAIAPAYSIDKVTQLTARDNVKVVRAMPNTPSMIGCGMAGVSFSSNFTDVDKSLVLGFFKSFGEAIEVKESIMPAVGSVSGSSPAFIYMMIEAMAQGAIQLGMQAKDAYLFAAKSVEGAAKMVEQTREHPSVLRDAVCSAGGTTIEGVVSLEQSGFKGALIEAMLKSSAKFKRMEEESNK